MEENQSAKNIRIAKNTFFLYLRMFLMMGISLYTSRIVLSTLGEVDYGLYNVVGGIVTMFTFVNFAMTCATNRYLSFELGKNNIENVNKVFSTSIIIHVVIAIFIFLLGETIGPVSYTHLDVYKRQIYPHSGAYGIYDISSYPCFGRSGLVGSRT